MHSALLVDEIFRQILDECDDLSDPSSRTTLSRLSRCCQAWKDAALDQLWRRLPSISPLLSLIPGHVFVNGQHTLARHAGIILLDELSTFHSYARRVHRLVWTAETHICRHLASYLEDMRIHSSTGTIFPQLASFHGTFVVAEDDVVPWSIVLSGSLRHVDIHGRFKLSKGGEGALSNWLTRLSCVARLDSFNYWGCARKTLGQTISSLSTVRSMSLRTGSQLGFHEGTLAGIATFPRLHTLKLTLHDISAAQFFAALNDFTGPIFPALQKLHIDTSLELLDCIIEHLPQDTLRSLHIEFPGSTVSNSMMPVLAKIADRAADTLQDLTIIHDVETDDIQYSLENEDDLHDPSVIARYGDLFWTIDTLQPLAKLRALRHFDLDTILPPLLRHKDVDELLGWWPRAERVHLAFGSREEDASPFAKNIALQLEQARGIKSLVLPKRDALGRPFDIAALSRCSTPAPKI